MGTVREQVQREAPSVYSKELIEQIFRQPYCKIHFLERAGMGTRQTCSKYLRELERLGGLHGQKIGREIYFINRGRLTCCYPGSTENFIPTVFSTARMVFSVGLPFADSARYSASLLMPASAATAPSPP